MMKLLKEIFWNLCNEQSAMIWCQEIAKHVRSDKKVIIFNTHPLKGYQKNKKIYRHCSENSRRKREHGNYHSNEKGDNVRN